jgi:signal transduction histidine kinase
MPLERPLVDIRLWSGFSRRIMAAFLGAGFLIGGILTAASTWNQKRQFEASLVLRGRALVRSMGRAAFVPLVLEDVAALDTLDEGFKEEPDVVYAAIYTAQGKVLSQRPPGLDLPLEPEAQAGAADVLQRRLPPRGGSAVWDLVFPLRYAAGPAGAKAELSGYVRLGLTEQRVNREIRRALFKNLALGAAIIAAAFVLIALLIESMTRRMRELIEQVQTTSELRRTNKELEAFSYSVSHDLRAPLRAIDGFSHALLQEYGSRLEPRGQDYLARVRAGCARMARMIDDLLGLSRVIRQEMRRESVDLAALARSVAEDLGQSQPERRVAFSAPVSAVVHGDPGLLRIALENLLNNAWKFTQKTEAPTVEFGDRPDGGARVFYVRDNGAGFDMAYAGKLFGAFQRLHDAAEFPGTGIGLATVQRIIQRHGGRLWAEAAVGRGASFFFTLGEGT